MALPMDQTTFLAFYRDTMQSYSKSFKRYTVKLLKDKGLITFDEQVDFGSAQYVEKGTTISSTTMNPRFSGFYELLEFTKLYKYSVPIFYESSSEASLPDVLDSLGCYSFDPDDFTPTFTISTSITECLPLYWTDGSDIYIKFVLQKSYYNPSNDLISYRFPIVIYINTEAGILEIRYDSTRYDPHFSRDDYRNLVVECIRWLRESLNLKLFTCEHRALIPTIKRNTDGSVKIYKQMMDLSSGGAAELTASESTDYVLPFIGELRELISENEELFNCSPAIRELLTKYLDDKEATASYPYVYVKWVMPVETDSYMIKITFDYFDSVYTVMQHISGDCKDLGRERMNNAIKYLCESGSYTKGVELWPES